MQFPPLPKNISIPAVIAGNVLQFEDTSVSVVEDGFNGSIIMKTDNQLAMIINQDRKVSFNTQQVESMLTINNNTEGTSTLRLSYQNSFYFDGRISGGGAVFFAPSCDDPQLNPTLTTIFNKNFNIEDHDGASMGFHLGGSLVQASATELNYVDVPVGVARANKALVLNSSKTISGITRLDASSLSGTMLTADQPNITSLHTINITGSLSIAGQLLDVSPETLKYLIVPAEGVAYPSKAVILSWDKNFSGINNLTATTITGTLISGSQPNITELNGLQSITNNGYTTLNGSVVIATASNQLVLKYSNTVMSQIGTNIVGDLTFGSSSKRVSLESLCSLYIPSHDGGSTGLVLGSDLVVATAKQINFTQVVAGTAAPSKAVVLDSSKNISGIGALSAQTITGAIQTSAQPLISSVSILNITGHNGSTAGLSLGGTLITATAAQLNYLNTPTGSASASRAVILDASLNFTGINTLSATALTGILLTNIQPNIKQVNTLTITSHNGTTGLVLGSTLITATGAELNRVSVVAGVADAGKAMVLDGSKNIYGINNFTANNLSGVLQTASQPNIIDVNTLNVATHDGGTMGLSLSGTLVTASASQLNRVNVAVGTAMRNKAVVLDTNLSIAGINVLSANSMSGELTTSTQPHIRSLMSINITNHNGLTSGLSLNGTLITSAAYQLNYVNTDQGIGAAGRAVILDSSRSINNINSLSATFLNGIIQTESQPHITQVATLNIANHNANTTGLSLNNVLITASAAQINTLTTTPGIAMSNKAMVLNEASNIIGINTLTATTLTGTLSTIFQPNLTSVNTLNIQNHTGTTGLSLAGILITASAAQINTLNTTTGVASPSKVLIVDGARSISGINTLTATSINGTMTTASQPNINSVNGLDIVGHNGSVSGLKLAGILVLSTAQQLNFNAVIPGTASPSHSLVTDSTNSITGINSLSAAAITAAKLTLSGVISNFNTGSVVIKSYSSTDMIGRVVDVQLLTTTSFSSSFKPAAMTNGYSCEIIGYIYPAYSETYTFYTTCNDRIRLWVNGQLLVNSWIPTSGAIASLSIFLNANQWVPIYAQFQVDVGSSPYLRIEWLSNSTTRSPIGSANIAWDDNPPSSGSNFYSQNSMTVYNTSTVSANTAKFSVDTSGDLTIDASGNTTTLGIADSLNIPSHNGTSSGLYLAGVLIQPTAYEINYLKVSPGVTAPSHALVVDASNSITGINSLSATSISCSNLSTNAFTISNLSLSGPLSNYNTGGLLIRQITGANVSGRVVNVATTTNINLNQYDPRGLNTNYSLDIIGYILPQYTEAYVFRAIANDRVRIWVNNTLILNDWGAGGNTEYVSSAISLTAGQWVPIYIQFENTNSTQLLQITWSSATLIKTTISSSAMAWDNSFVNPFRPINSPDQITLFSSASGLTTVQTASLAVDGNGNMTMDAKSGLIKTATATSFNIVSHNGSTAGLHLGGSLVVATASELNYLAGVSPGTVFASKAVILDSNKTLTGFTTLSSTNLIGTIQTAAQPNITSIGTLTSTLNSTSDIIVRATNILRLTADTTTCYIQAGSSSTINTAADLFVGNYDTTPSVSARKFMIKASGNVGIQTYVPNKTLSINGQGSTYCMRLINNASDGTETAYCDIGVSPSSTLMVASNLSIGSTGTATLSVSELGVLNISPSGGTIQIGNTTNSTIPLEVGSASFTLSSTSGYINSSGSTGITVPTATQYSIRTTSSIIVNGTVCITSDRRLKEEMRPLIFEDCRDFIMNSNPIKFSYKDDPTKARHCGLVAQEVAKTKFNDLVRVAPHVGLQKEIDHDGYISHENEALNVSYQEIIPILMTTIKEMLNTTKELTERIRVLEQSLGQH